MTRLTAAGLCGLAAAALAGCGGEQTKPVSIDANAGRVGRVAIGDTRAKVIAALGKPGEVDSGGPFTPLDEYYEEIGGPPAISTPGPGEILRYRHLAVLLESGRVYSMIASGPARTTAGVGIGDSLADVKKAFGHPYCSELGAESGASWPFCSFPVGAGRIAFGKDPVKSITLTAHPGG